MLPLHHAGILGGFQMSECLLSWLLLALYIQDGLCTNLVIQIPPSSEGVEGATYRLDYSPPFGRPGPNSTIPARDIEQEIQFSDVLPGSRYKFKLYYTNSTHKDLALYIAAITTVPDPPSNLNVSVINGTSVLVKFSSPKRGEWMSFNLKLISIVENKPPKIIVLNSTDPFILNDLTPGGTYQVQIFTVFDGKESISHAVYNITTRPSAPTHCIVWFRNETMLQFLWQPPADHSIYSQYKVVINPKDAQESVLHIDKGDPPGPANALFRDLVPGRTYNLSVQSYSLQPGSEGMLSLPITAQYWTSPLRPARLRVDPSTVTPTSFTVNWDPPDALTYSVKTVDEDGYQKNISNMDESYSCSRETGGDGTIIRKCSGEYDKYRISINLHQPPVMRNKSEPRSVTYSERLQPGHTYIVSAMTVSGKVNSSEAVVYVTLKPMPVLNVKAVLIDPSGYVKVTWTPSNSSLQDSFEVSYTEVYNGTVLNGDTNFMITKKTEYLLESLLPGRNYSIGVKAVSNNTLSSPVVTFQATRPSAPVIEELKPIEYGLNISWKSDVNSRQEKYEVRHKRNDSNLNQFKLNITKDTNILIENLYPGAGYNIRVYAISHGLKSDPHDYFQAVYPKPPTNLNKDNETSNSVTLSWERPKDSLLSGYSVRFRTEDNQKWTKNAVKNTGVEITELVPGQRYFIKINSVSFNVESAQPLILNHTVNPSPVTNIASLVDSNNVTVDFPRPVGRIEYYVINWITREISTGEQRTKTVKATNGNDEHVKILVDDLMPGVLYQFDIHTVSFGLRSYSTLFAARTMPLILSELVVVSHPQETSVMTVHYTPTSPSLSHFDKYLFKLSGSGEVLEKNISDTIWEVTFINLTPGKLYNVTVWTVSDKVFSQPLSRQDRLYPDPVPKLFATHIADTHVTLVWERPEGEFSSYEVQYMNTEGILEQNLTKLETCTIENLKPYRNYTFTVTVRSGSDDSNYLRRSLPVTAVFQTQEGKPGKPIDFRSINVLPREITFAWSLPESEWNGVLKNFTIDYGLEGSSLVEVVSFRPDEMAGSIKDLIPGKTYKFEIKAQTTVGFGPGESWQEEMPIFAPPKPSSQLVPTEVSRSSSTIQIRFRKNYFSEENGPIINYTVIVAEDDKKNTSLIEMPSWIDVQGYGVWPPYQVMEPYFPFKNSTIVDFIIGIEDCSRILRGYCNGPLKSGTAYRVKIRAFTAVNKFTDTDYSFPIQTDTNPWPVVLGIVLGIISISLIIGAVIVFRKFKISLQCGKKEPKKKVSVTLSLADCIIETSKPIKIDKFAAYCEIMSADSDFRFSEEFEQLRRVGQDQSCYHADLPCNRPKNRFTNILPYDHSRFKLQPEDDNEGSDYINANYITGFNSPREFIATQGPLPSTKDDFWRMCWESNCKAIVMLTRCVEKGREKCDHYWPEDTKTVYYGDISVTISNESYFPDWTITEFIVKRGDIQRVVRHFHFISWPDFGVPNPPTILVRFVKMFRERINSESRPIIVHCSAGVGRSGTFIAIDKIMQAISHGADSIDIFGAVYIMRKERINMVQTEQQYICIHQCILSVLQGSENQSLRDENHQNQGFDGKPEEFPVPAIRFMR